MADPAERYRKLIDATLRAALTARLHRPLPDGLTMELALPAIAWRMKLFPRSDPALQLAAELINATPTDAPVRDGAGQTRSLYRPLLMRFFSPLGSRLPKGSIVEYDRATQPPTAAFASAKGPLLTSDGSSVAASLFAALVPIQGGAVEGIESEGNLADAFRRVLAAQSIDGRFLSSTSADQLEPAWYHELAVLHAVTRFASYVKASLPSHHHLVKSARDAVRRSASYHAAEVQPDHASSHPFGLAALLDDAEGVYLADMMLHAAGCQQPSTMDAVSLVLLFDSIEPAAVQK